MPLLTRIANPWDLSGAAAVDVDIKADWQEGQRARNEFLESQPELLFQAAQELRRSSQKHGRIAIYGRLQLNSLAFYASRLFMGGGVIGQGPKIPVFVLQQLNEVRSLTGPNDLLLWLTLNPVDELDASIIAECHARGMKVVALASAPGEYLDQISDHQIILPTRHLVVASEMLVTVLHSLYKMASESELSLDAEEARMRSRASTRKVDRVDLLASESLALKRSPTRPVTRALNRMASGNLARFRCGACREVITVERQLAGQKFACPNCGQVVVIPDLKPKTKDENGEKRRAARFKVHHGRALFKLKSGWLEHGEVIEDVSMTGVGIRLIRRSLDEFDRKSPLTMALDFPAFREPVRVNGIVRRVVNKDKATILGIEFTEMSETARSRLERLQANAALRNVKRR